MLLTFIFKAKKLNKQELKMRCNRPGMIHQHTQYQMMFTIVESIVNNSLGFFIWLYNLVLI